MTFDQIILILIVLATTTLYITRWTPIEVTSALAISALVFSELLTVDQALSGFASAAMITVAAMFVLSGGLLRTGALEQVTVFLVRTARWQPAPFAAVHEPCNWHGQRFCQQHAGCDYDGADSVVVEQQNKDSTIQVADPAQLSRHHGRHDDPIGHQHQYPCR